MSFVILLSKTVSEPSHSPARNHFTCSLAANHVRPSDRKHTCAIFCHCNGYRDTQHRLLHKPNRNVRNRTPICSFGDCRVAITLQTHICLSRLPYQERGYEKNKIPRRATNSPLISHMLWDRRISAMPARNQTLTALVTRLYSAFRYEGVKGVEK